MEEFDRKTDGGKKVTIDLIMLSSFNRAGGGRETWAYNFLPRLLQEKAEVSLYIYGLKNNDEADHSSAFCSYFADSSRRRLSVKIFNAAKSRLPRVFLMVGCLLRSPPRANGVADELRISLGVGSVIELAMILLFRNFRTQRRVLWLRGIYLHEKAPRIPFFLEALARKIEISILSKAHVILANGDDIAEHYRALGLEVTVIKNGVDLARWQMPPPTLKAPIKVAFVGRLSKVKGIEEFFRSIELVRARDEASNFEFHIVGDGEYASRAVELAKLGHLKYHGAKPNDEIAEFLRNIDVCVALTFSSSTLGGGGTSNALMEQMAAGKIIIAWDNPHFRQLVEEDIAYLVGQGRCDELADTLVRICGERDVALAKALGGVEVIKRYSFQAQVDRFADIILAEH
ncbi:glycosyltransferase family 4 protein [Mesorhizobium sp. C280B]|uniref:glycosyltransferase family 4 protein n=1 Tax=unclassified Mesorhizobium TaxID=325217 RepID=UPI0018DC9FD8|nr:glycosyltransferase family 4 protein [Mesorhizobium sp. LSJC280B00]